MQKLVVKTLKGRFVLENPPNGGWAWIVMWSAFVINGIALGTSKTMGIYFTDIKNQFGISNTAVSWLLTAEISILTFSGFLGKLMLRWFNARQVIMVGGILSSIGLLIFSLSPHVSVLFIGACLTGIGFGMSAITSLSQTSLYFSTWRPLANGIALGGSTVMGSIYPYLNQYLLDEYGWRGAFLISSGITLNTCVAGALIRPISAMSKNTNKVTSTGDEPYLKTEPCTSKLADDSVIMISSGQHESNIGSGETSPIKENMFNSCVLFFRRYWLGFGFLFVHFLVALSMFIPNIFIVPYAKELGLTVIESVLLLSFLSVGDFVGRVLTGLMLSKINFLRKHIFVILSASKYFMTATQFVPTFFTTFPVLFVYVTVYGAMYGAMDTLCLSALGQFVAPQLIESSFASFFASEGFGLLASGPISGAVVDEFGSYQGVFWYAMLPMFVSGSLCFVLTALVRRRGAVIMDNGTIRQNPK